MKNRSNKEIPELEGLVYSILYDLSKFEEGPRQQIGVLYHTNFKDIPRVIAIRPHAIEALEWVAGQGLYYTSKNDVWKLWDSEGNEIDRHIQKGKAPICALAWIPGLGLCNAGREGIIRRSTDENGNPSGGIIAERSGRVYSLLWIPNRGLFDAGCSSEYHQIRKCLDKSANKIDEFIAERIGWQQHNGEISYSLPTLFWIPEIGLLDNGGFLDQDDGLYSHNQTLIRYLDETGNQCTELLAINEGDLAYVDAVKYKNTCRLYRHQFGIKHLLRTGVIFDWIQIPDQCLFYADDDGIHKFLNTEGIVVANEIPDIRTHPHKTIAMTWINNQ